MMMGLPIEYADGRFRGFKWTSLQREQSSLLLVLDLFRHCIYIIHTVGSGHWSPVHPFKLFRYCLCPHCG